MCRQVTLVLLVLLLGCDRQLSQLTLSSANICSPEQQALVADFTLNCINNANQAARGDDTDDAVRFCAEKATVLFCPAQTGFYYYNAMPATQTAFVPCAKAVSQDEKNVCASVNAGPP